MVFRRHHSHAWVEVLWNGRWYSFDPTPPMRSGLFARTPGWQSWWEGVRGRFARIFHLLKEGEWRRVVDDWQVTTQGLLDNPLVYGIPLLLLLVILVRRLLKRNRHKVRIKPDERVLNWIHLLDRVEKILKRQGFVRMPGETVGAFLARVEPQVMGSGEILGAVKSLREYEMHRWR